MSTSYRGFQRSGGLNPDEDTMDLVNQSMAEALSMKVGQLKSIAIELDGETRDHIPLLDDLGDNMDTTSHRMGGSSTRMRYLTRTRAGMVKNLTCMVSLAVFVFLFFIYYLMSRSGPE